MSENHPRSESAPNVGLPSSGTVTVERTGAIVTVMLSHPGKLNAISVAMWREIGSQFAALSEDFTVRGILICGAGNDFAAGADIGEFPVERGDLESVIRYHEEILAPALRAVAECPHPTVAAIAGVCVGGGLELACQCDLRIATTSARLGVPIGQLGFPMAPEEFRGLLAVAGRSLTLELLLEGRILPAPDALAKGLLTRVVADDALDAAIGDCFQQILKGSPEAARHNKATLRRLMPATEPWTSEERRAFYASWSDSFGHREGVSAFLEKRSPAF